MTVNEAALLVTAPPELLTLTVKVVAVIGEGRGRRGVAAGGCAGDRGAVLRPLVFEGRARRGYCKVGRETHRNTLIGRLHGDGRGLHRRRRNARSASCGTGTATAQRRMEDAQKGKQNESRPFLGVHSEQNRLPAGEKQLRPAAAILMGAGLRPGAIPRPHDAPDLWPNPYKRRGRNRNWQWQYAQSAPDRRHSLTAPAATPDRTTDCIPAHSRAASD